MYLLLLSLALAAVNARSPPTQPPVFPGLPSINKLCESVGLPCTNVLVTTDDGYALWLHRLGNSTGPPLLLQHGLFAAADMWLARSIWDPDLAVLLVKEGYDVYLGNIRGNVFNPYNVNIKRTDPRYWDFSFHESGLYDLPAMIDWILKFRGAEQLFYLGHSLGTTFFLTMASKRPEYNSKIKASILLAPVAFSPDPSEFSIGIIRLAIMNRNHIVRALEVSNIWELVPRTANTIKGVKDICAYKSPTQDTCLDFVGQYVGEHRGNFNRKTIAYQLSFSPAGTSAKTMYHLSQVFKTANFTEMDYGPRINAFKYNRTTPPLYPLEKVTAPVALFWSYNDNLISEKSVSRLAAALPNVIYHKPIKDPKFTHGDYFMGLNAKEMVYDDVINLINQYR